MKPPKQIPGCLPEGFNLDSLLTVPQFALWKQVEESTARNQIAAGDVPVIRHSREDVKIHPRTYLESRVKKG